ncbi:MAG TPA: CbiX/SirB N-terminal domain-containing protein [Bryobacteraceae bacterium]|nr:CbiX/SirB N-terminal domain-containing protein [Bryobacteraceae bacterium]
MPATAIIIFGHGSSVETANDAVRNVAQSISDSGGFDLVEAAFLEQGRPDLAAAVASLVSKGATRVVVVPYFLTLGLHLQRDLPGIVDRIRLIHPGVDIRVSAPLDGHPALGEILKERVREALAAGDPA